MSTTLTAASRQWMTRPDDERFTSLLEMQSHFEAVKAQCREIVVSSRKIQARPVSGDHRALEIVGPNGHAYNPTHFSFGQLAQLAEAPAGYLRTLPAEIAADNINYGLQFKRQAEEVGVLLQANGEHILRAANGPKYGRIWNAEIVAHLIHRFGDGVTGDWTVPGEFGKRVIVTKDNTTLFAGDRDLFIFLADEEHRIANPARNGAPLARGFFVWNSEVGATSFGVATFLFDYVCCNRIVWGATEYKELRMRHSVAAPDRFMDEMRPALTAYANSSAATITDAITKARKARIDGADGELDKFLNARFSRQQTETIKKVHELEEHRPIENLWDAATAITAYARNIGWQNERVAVERKAGEILDLAAK